MAHETILIIEDNHINMKMVRVLLSLNDYKVLEAKSAEEGLEIARVEQPDLILMDIQLPGMDGLKATAIVKQEKALNAIPVVALTSYALEGDEDRALAAGCDGYLTKPIDTRNFLDTIKQYLKPQKQEAVLQPRFSSTAQKATILIVDDEVINLKVLVGILSQFDYRLITAQSGPEALTRIAQDPPDLILLDIMMPGMDGYEVTRRIKTDPATRSIPIILVTALSSTKDKVKGMEAGAEEFVTKPVNPVEIDARVRSMLKLKRYRDQLDIRAKSENQIFVDDTDLEKFEAQQNSGRILLVEDDYKDRKLILTYLQEYADRLDVAVDGQEAIQKARNNDYDLVLLDIMLPQMNGFDICRQIKQDETTHDVQVVLISCLSDMENKIKGVELGADDYLIKPINPRELQARVKVLLKKKNYLDSLHSHCERALNSALMDGLTQLYNHAYFKRFLELEISRSKRQGHATSLLMIDLDDFKQINDTLGHMAGDDVLRTVSKLIKESIREIDIAARYGGEEFAVVLPYGDQIAASIVGERIREKISCAPLMERWGRHGDRITVSIGAAVYPAEAQGADELIATADGMLYKAKREGKNRVAFAAEVKVPA